MNYELSLQLYRFLTRAYPTEFRMRFGASLEQAFRDMMRDAFEKHGYLGMALLWFHVIPDFLFSVAEVLTKKAGDFLKWRLRLHWVIACTVGFALARCIALLVGPEFYIDLERNGLPGMILSSALKLSILTASVSLLQAWVLAGRCFRKKEWVLYGLIAGVLAAVVLTPLLLVTAPSQTGIIRWVGQTFAEPVSFVAISLVTNAPLWLIFGALMGVLQATAIRSDAISRYQWMGACAVGYCLSAIAGGFAIPYPFVSVLNVILTSVVSGAVLGLVTSSSLERVLFNVQADSTE